ncbi:NAD(P)(+) transhydrogenase (Re/Si-specific) subunit beta [Paraburkholderia sp.]|uniref:NAD(P)(+) transhydrogenase (Re/Si-specific) subunit beta n=1 Tax=Paraburkholderia sp. TaxID=1926495 RepID=UPI00238930AB|nr:NAD(P)(+) transhydrogenase (Re/Si-specific) subunit beta [Paraburkholderia sp.]MDE1179748.1 NAD(P)(+) transhydrogenase (Re/Si-specific) subunit beta [Paraburkholderia sp.]
MPELAGNTVWMISGFLLSVVLAGVVSGVTQLTVASATSSVKSPAVASYAGPGSVVIAGWLAAGAGANANVVVAAIVGAALGAWLARRRDMTRRPATIALLGSGIGLAAVSCGLFRYQTSDAWESIQRAEMYIAVFFGALMFAGSAVAFGKWRGALDLRDARRPGYSLVNLGAVILCVWLGYDFVTRDMQPFGMSALLSMSGLAAALGAHLTMTTHQRGRTSRGVRKCGKSLGLKKQKTEAVVIDEFIEWRSWSHCLPQEMRWNAFRDGRQWRSVRRVHREARAASLPGRKERESR